MDNKYCSICETIRPIENFSSHLTKKGRVQIASYCRPCANKVANDWYHANKSRAIARMSAYSAKWRTSSDPNKTLHRQSHRRRLIVDNKIPCSRCKQNLPFSSFYTCHVSPAGYTSACKECHKLDVRNHYQQKK